MKGWGERGNGDLSELKEVATHSSILAWEIPQTEKSGVVRTWLSN